jgi:nucleoid-associated protein YgaU
MKAQLVNKMMPAENVAFDFNPEVLTVNRTASSNSNTSPSGPKGATPSIFRGSQPATFTADAWLEGADVKDRAEQLLSWCEPGGGMLGKVAGAAMGALTAGRMNLASKLPVLIFMWGPFLIECVLTGVRVGYERFDTSGEPTRAKVNFTIKEEPSLLAMLPTNPTSGGPPGRKRHVVSQGESLALIASRTYGHPGLWRAVAEANGIDDPFRMTPGRVLLLPSVSELSGHRG